MTDRSKPQNVLSAFESPTFGKDGSFEVNKPVGSMSISPCGRDVVLASRQGLHIIDLDSPWVPPRHLAHHTPWEVADVQWSPFPARDYWIVSTSNQKALVWNLAITDRRAPVEFYLHAHNRAITDINFSAHHLDILATCAVDSFVHCWDLRTPSRPALSFCDWYAGATQVKWNRQDGHVIASSHDKYIRIWDDRKGAHPLRSIEAHATKIYGLDWNRVNKNALITCSLDQTIKMWDYSKEQSYQEHVIRTPFPVWRARHTPFGSGILAMPQRGDNSLYLYDSRERSSQGDAYRTPVKIFEGHRGQVKEFLWRSRGSIEATVDEREFQLVSWGAGHLLRLHALDETVLAGVGYVRGKEVHPRFNFTRKNAPYKTFQESSVSGGNSKSGMFNLHRSGITLPSRSSVFEDWTSGGFLSSRPALVTKADANRDMDPITWMKGVKIGKKEAQMEGSTASLATHDFRAGGDWEDFESLGEEIAHVGGKFSKTEFLEIDVTNRFVKLSMRGLWDSKETSTFLKCRFDFPNSYPSEAAPELTVEKTPSIEHALLEKLQADVENIGAAYARFQRNSFEALLRYLHGDQTVEETIAWPREDQDQSMAELQDPDESSSDEEDEVDGNQADELGTGNSDVLNATNLNADMPLPRTSGALWARDGQLVCFCPPKEERQTSLTSALRMNEREAMNRGRRRILEGFGKVMRNSKSRSMMSSLGTWNSSESVSDINGTDSERSSSISSSSSQEYDAKDLRLASHIFETEGFGLHVLQSDVVADETLRSAPSVSIPQGPAKVAETVVSIHKLDSLLPSREDLAREYVHSGLSACQRNATVASGHGLQDLASVWLLLDFILDYKVSLRYFSLQGNAGSPITGWMPEEAFQKERRRPLIKRNPIHGLKSAFGRVKWGQHPFGSSLLIKYLFEYFSKIADVQMLALMSCTLGSKPHTVKNFPGTARKQTEGGEISGGQPYQQNPKTRYFPSLQVASSLFQKKVTEVDKTVPFKRRQDPALLSSSPMGEPTAQHKPASPAGAGGSAELKAIRWNLNGTETANQLSGSPEMMRSINKSTSNLASAFAASLSKPFTFSVSSSSSPPSGAFSEKRISSIGSFAIRQDPSDLVEEPDVLDQKPDKRKHRESIVRKFSNAKFDAPASRNRRVSGMPRQSKVVTIQLKNQDQFQLDGYADSPLLDPTVTSSYQSFRRAYGDFLINCQLPVKRSEVLKHDDWSKGKDKRKQLPSGQSGSDILAIGKKASSELSGLKDSKGKLDLSVHCSTCGMSERSQAGTRPSRCSSCKLSIRPLCCVLCYEIIRGRASPCLKCGHIMHEACRTSWLVEAAQSDDNCVTGCGCSCTYLVDPPVVQWSTKGDSASQRSKAHNTKTVVEDSQPSRVDFEQRWRDIEADLAYESLAKNLEAPRKHSIRASKSQVWRGRERRGASMGNMEERKDRNFWLGV